MTNRELNQLSIYSHLKCYLCLRSYPNTILNIEGYIHHNQRVRCTDHVTCNRTLKKLKHKAQ